MALSLDDLVGSAIVTASDHRSGSSGQVVLAVGKTKRALLDIDDGRVVAARMVPVEEAGEVPVTVPVTSTQLGALVAGEESLAQAFMRGDVKPEGATGPLLALIELFEDPTFRSRLADLVPDA